LSLCFDTNVVLDLLLARSPFDVDAEVLAAEVERGTLVGCVCATSVTTVDYLVGRHAGRQRARQAIKLLLTLFDVAPVTRAVLEDAFDLPFEDYEDAVLHESARRFGARGIVTRDPAGFRRSKLRVYSPAEARQALSVRRELFLPP
jgi:predicted nucleic acid-binding protein